MGEVVRVRADEPDTTDAILLVHRAQELAEPRPRGGIGSGEVAPVRVHVLPEEGHLHHAARRCALDLGQDVAQRPGPLRPAHERDDAERAVVVAADAHRDPGVMRRARPRGQRAREDLGVFAHVHLGAVSFGRADEIEEPRQRVGADHHVDPRRSRLDAALVLLREAPGHDDPKPRVRILHRLQVPERAVQSVVGVLAHGAGVEHDDLGVGRGGGRRVAVALEEARDALGVVLVHLTPERPDEIAPGHADESTSLTSHIRRHEPHARP